MSPEVSAIVRHFLQLGAGALAAKGVVDGGATELIIGAGMSIATLAWYLITSKTVAKK